MDIKEISPGVFMFTAGSAPSVEPEAMRDALGQIASREDAHAVLDLSGVRSIDERATRAFEQGAVRVGGQIVLIGPSSTVRESLAGASIGDRNLPTYASVAEMERQHNF